MSTTTARLLTSLCGWLAIAPTIAAAAEPLTVTAEVSRPTVEKGGVFDISLALKTETPVSQVEISPVVAHGFRLKPVPGAGYAKVNGSAVTLDHLAGEANLTFRVWAPGTTGKAVALAGDGANDKATETEGTISTAEPKRFAFNITYHGDAGTGAPTVRQTSVVVSVRYTTNLFIYLLAGMTGVLLGYYVKTGVKKRGEISAKAAEMRSRGKWAPGMQSLALASVAGLFTILVIGGVTLVVLAKDGIPVTDYRQAFALGVGLAVLADDELLAKLRG